MRRKIWFGIVITRQLLTIVEEIWFPRPRSSGTRARSPQTQTVFRMLRVATAGFAVWGAWRQLKMSLPRK